MVQLKGELRYLGRNLVKLSKNADFTIFFNIKKLLNWAKSQLFQIEVI